MTLGMKGLNISIIGIFSSFEANLPNFVPMGIRFSFSSE